jgi:hypothetical protein
LILLKQPLKNAFHQTSFSVVAIWLINYAGFSKSALSGREPVFL